MQKDYTVYVGLMFCWWNIEVMEGAKDHQVKGVSKGLHSLCGFNVLLVEYRGYGRGEGSPSEGGE